MRQEMIRLRSDERASVTKIAAQFGVSVAGVYDVVKGLNIRIRPAVSSCAWTKQEKGRLTRMWKTEPMEKIIEALPNRTRAAICRKGADLRLRRERTNSAAKNSAHPLFLKLRKIREQSGLTRKHLAHIIGIHHIMIARWELGTSIPSWRNIIKWYEALYCDVHVASLATEYYLLRRWAEWEDKALAELAVQGATVEEIASYFKRTVEAVKTRARRLGIREFEKERLWVGVERAM
jgi:transcriptional regulator with XRE-family HTH domain